MPRYETAAGILRDERSGVSLKKFVKPKCMTTPCRGAIATLGPPALPNKAIGSQVSDRTLVSTNIDTRLEVAEGTGL
jgi:hypothetical protein